MWPTSFALTALTPANEATIIALMEKAVSQGLNLNSRNTGQT
jgi:hypothetical protein